MSNNHQNTEIEQEVIANDLRTITRIMSWAVSRIDLIESGSQDLVLAKNHVQRALELLEVAQ